MGTAIRTAFVVLLAVAIALLCLASCGTDASGVSICKQLEEARCNQAPACNISITPPYTTSGSDVDACKRFYDIACLHGLENDNGPINVNGCIAAINKSCSAVKAPESDPACAWLVPPMTAPPDASDAPAESSGAPSEAGDAETVPDSASD
jgi:hypothetical protein